MFTGIVEEISKVMSAQTGNLVIDAGAVLRGIETGGSIAVNGVCLTVTDFTSNSFSVDLMPETLQQTNLGLLVAGSKVNLERPLTLGKPLGGHLVQGHIDGMGKVTSIARDGTAVIIRFEAPPEVMSYIVKKGFITVDGVSLTVLSRDDSSFQVSIVDFTRQHTILSNQQVGVLVNLEADIIAKYVEQFNRPQDSGITVELLQEHGFLAT
ncbi:riboflavin synthase [Chloroflexota bacterium]